MKHFLPMSVVAVAVAAVTMPAHAAGSVDVQFVNPEQFADIGTGAFERERVLGQLRGMFQDLAKKLPDGQTLELAVHNVNLAGEIEPGRARGDLRVMRGGADWPKIDMSYTLRDGTHTIKSGKAQLADMNYLMSISPARIQGTLSFETRMVQRWFDDTFGQR